MKRPVQVLGGPCLLWVHLSLLSATWDQPQLQEAAGLQPARAVPRYTPARGVSGLCEGFNTCRDLGGFETELGW